MEQRRSKWSSAGRLLVAGIAAAGSLTVGTAVAGADGTQTPVGAPTIRVGVTEFGNTASPDANPRQDYYRLPALQAGDLVTVAARTPAGTSYRYACLEADVDGYNWQQEACNLARGQSFDSSGQRMQFRASRSTNNAFLRVYTGRSGPFEVTVEKIQRQVGLSVNAPAPLKANGTVIVAARLTNGQSAPDGYGIQLVVRVNGRDHAYVARTRAGRATFTLSLPGDAADKQATLTARSPETAQYQAASSIPANLRIVK